MKKLLIVDDEKSLAETMASFFKNKFDLETFTAFTVKEAISIIKTHKPQILLVDLHLGGKKSGLDIIKLAKEITPDSQIIVFTGLPDESLETQSKELGAQYFIPKPIKIEELSGLIEKIIKGLG